MMTLRTGSPTMGRRKRCSVKRPKSKSDNKGEKERQDKGDAPVVEGQADIGSDQGQLAHGQVENPGAFVNEGPAQGDKGIDASDENPCNEKLQESSINPQFSMQDQ